MTHPWTDDVDSNSIWSGCTVCIFSLFHSVIFYIEMFLINVNIISFSYSLRKVSVTISWIAFCTSFNTVKRLRGSNQVTASNHSFIYNYIMFTGSRNRKLNTLSLACLGRVILLDWNCGKLILNFFMSISQAILLHPPQKNKIHI